MAIDTLQIDPSRMANPADSAKNVEALLAVANAILDTILTSEKEIPGYSSSSSVPSFAYRTHTHAST
jgi:hypothetical protein